MREFYKFVWRASASQQIVLIILAVMAALLAMAPLELQRHIINTLAGHEKAERLFWLCGGYLIAALSIGGLKYTLNIKSAGLGESMILSLRNDIFRSSSLHRSDDRLDETIKDKAGTFVAMIATEAEAVGKFVGDCISTPTVQAGTLLSVLGYMLYTEPLLGLVVLFIALPQIFAVPMIQRRINTLVRERVRTVRRAGDLVVDNMQGGGGSSASSLGSEIGKAFWGDLWGASPRIQAQVWAESPRQRTAIGRRLRAVVCRRDHGSQREDRNRYRGGLHQRTGSCPRSLARIDRIRAIDLQREGSIRPDRGHLGQETVKSPTGEPTGLHRETPMILIETIPLIMREPLRRRPATARRRVNCRQRSSPITFQRWYRFRDGEPKGGKRSAEAIWRSLKYRLDLAGYGILLIRHGEPRCPRDRRPHHLIENSLRRLSPRMCVAIKSFPKNSLR
jgi:hypothetical protein